MANPVATVRGNPRASIRSGSSPALRSHFAEISVASANSKIESASSTSVRTDSVSSWTTTTWVADRTAPMATRTIGRVML
jgi:hypothetical protein